MKRNSVSLFAVFCVSAISAYGQASPTVAARGPVLPGAAQSTTPGQLIYTLSASESIIFGYQNVDGAANSTNLSGNAAYVSGSENHPTSFVYTGGYLFGNNGQPSTQFHNLGVSQVYKVRDWTFLASDLFSFLPNAPLYGLSGVAGIGDLGTTPISSGGLADSALLSNYGQRFTNTVGLGLSKRLTNSDTLSVTGTNTNQRFRGSVGLDNDQQTTDVQVMHRLDGRNSIGGSYNFLRSSYPDSPVGFNTHGANAVYQRVINPRADLSASVGPQWVLSSYPQLLPSRLTVAGSFQARYAMAHSSASLSYSRGTTGGTGVLYGSINDVLSLVYQRQFGTEWTAAWNASYGHASSLASVLGASTTVNSFYTGVQVNRLFGRKFSTYASYNVQVQDVSRTVNTVNAFNGTAHVISFGVTYIPRPIRIGRR